MLADMQQQGLMRAVQASGEGLEAYPHHSHCCQIWTWRLQGDSGAGYGAGVGVEQVASENLVATRGVEVQRAQGEGGEEKKRSWKESSRAKMFLLLGAMVAAAAVVADGTGGKVRAKMNRSARSRMHREHR